MRQHAFITAVKLGSAERLLAFCGAVQRCSPVGAFVEPVPGAHAPEGLEWTHPDPRHKGQGQIDDGEGLVTKSSLPDHVSALHQDRHVCET